MKSAEPPTQRRVVLQKKKKPTRNMQRSIRKKINHDQATKRALDRIDLSKIDQEHHPRNPGPKKTPAHALAAGKTALKRMKTKMMMRDIQTRIVEHTRRTIGCPKTRIPDAIRITHGTGRKGKLMPKH